MLRRYRELVRLARQNGFGPLPSAGGRAERTARGTGVRIRRVLEEAGGVYVKLGQIASTRPDLVPPEICAELAGLQNQVAPEPVERVREALEEELGADVDTLFAEFDWEPLAAGSIGQTYRACLRTGEPVVVKVQRPGIEDVMERDLAALALLAGVAQRRTPFGQGVRSAEMLAQFASSLRAELDFRREAEAMSEMTALLGPGSAVRVPKVYGELCTRRLLVQERFDGFTVADTATLDASGIDRRALGEQLLRSTLEQVLRIGFFHADPHPGNIFAFADGTLGLIDFGAVGRLDPVQQSAVIDMLAALARRDASLLARRDRAGGGHVRAGSSGTAGTGPRPPDGRSRASQRRRRADRAPGPRAHPGRLRHPAARRPGRALARAWSPSTARCASCRRGSRWRRRWS